MGEEVLEHLEVRNASPYPVTKLLFKITHASRREQNQSSVCRRHRRSLPEECENLEHIWASPGQHQCSVG